MPRLLAVLLSALTAAVGASGLALPMTPQPAPLAHGLPVDGDGPVPDGGERRAGRQVDRRVERSTREVHRESRRSRRAARENGTPPARPAGPPPAAPNPDSTGGR